MKRIFLIRHAKSSPAEMNLKDFERPLNKRGEDEAKEMAKKLLNTKINIDAFISSSAKRALKTSEIFADIFGRSLKDIIKSPELYEAYNATFYKVISELKDELNTACIFAHNPSVTHFANALTNTKIDDMPTAGIFAIEAETEHWRDFQKRKKSFYFLNIPQNNFLFKIKM